MGRNQPPQPSKSADVGSDPQGTDSKRSRTGRIRALEQAIGRTKLKYGRDFAKYLFVGILYTFVNIFLMWSFIDLLKTGTIAGSALAVSIIFITKYFVYIWVGFMVKGFLRYALVTGLVSVLNVALMWLLVDVLRVPTVPASTVIVYSLFFIRFLSFYAAGLVRNG